jgi:hypothetical protein
MPREDEQCVRFAPSEVLGFLDAREVAIFPDRVELKIPGQTIVYKFSSFARRQENVLVRGAKRLFGMSPRPLLVGEREFCTERRFLIFYTSPRTLVVFTPPDSDLTYGDTYFARINAVLLRGGFATWDRS